MGRVKVVVNFRLWANYTFLNLWSKRWRNKKGIFTFYVNRRGKKGEVFNPNKETKERKKTTEKGNKQPS